MSGVGAPTISGRLNHPQQIARILIGQAALPTLVPGGSVTLVSAVSSRVSGPATLSLAAINGSLESMVGILAREIAPTRVNAVSPGIVDVPWWEEPFEELTCEAMECRADTLPVGRIGRPDEVAQAIDMLTANGFVTGVVLPCDGGLHLL